jgi:putative tricarboxylic transport membrane protein
METAAHILNGFAVCLQPINIWYTFLGVFLGTVVGVLPGLGPAASIALLLPITYGMDSTSALIMLAAIFYGTRYGGSATAILIRTPGETSSMMTSLDGYEMARNGRAGAALAISAIGSFIAGTLGIVGLTVFAIPLASFAVKFGPAEYFMLMAFAMTAVAALSGDSPGKGMLSAVLGLMISTVGTDLQTGLPRFTLGVPQFLDGLDVVVIVVGLFAISEVLRGLEDLSSGNAPLAIRISGRLWLTREEWRRSVGPIWRGSIIGFIIGVLPGAGGTISSMLSYITEKRLSKNPQEFGKGAIEGVAGPEAANNADTAGALVPLLTLGVPSGGTTAVLLAAFVMYGIQPGPLLFQQRPDLVWGLVDSMYIGNVMLLILNLPLIGLFVRLLYIPMGILFPLIVTISVIGAYAVSGDVTDLYLLLIFGVVGYVFDKTKIPIPPLVLCFVLGGLMEQSFRQAMTISNSSFHIFVGSPIAVTLLFLCVASLVLPFVLTWVFPRTGAQIPVESK